MLCMTRPDCLPARFTRMRYLNQELFACLVALFLLSRTLRYPQAKRDKGQASRGKSYVEEEKRLLRELGSS